MKKIICFLLAVVIFACLCVGCAKLVSTEYETVEVTIIDEYRTGGYSVPMRVGKVSTMRWVPASYRIVVEYAGEKYTLTGYDTWKKYKGMVGEVVSATLEIRTYDDGDIRCKIICIA